MRACVSHAREHARASERRALQHDVFAPIASRNDRDFTVYRLGYTVHIALGSIGEIIVLREAKGTLLPSSHLFVKWLNLLQYGCVTRHLTQNIAFIAIPGAQGHVWQGIEDVELG